MVKTENTYILQIGDNDDFLNTYQTFYLTANSDDSLNALAWYQNEKAEICFKKTLFNTDKWNATYNALNSKNWNVNNTEIKKNKDPFLDSLEFILKRFNSWDTVDTNLIINKLDLNAKVLTYSFNSDNTFKLYKSNKIILSGKWNLFPNGRVIRLTPNDNEYKYEQETYSIPGSYFYIIDSNDDSLVIDKQEEIHINDTTFITKQTIQYWK